MACCPAVVSFGRTVIHGGSLSGRHWRGAVVGACVVSPARPLRLELGDPAGRCRYVRTVLSRPLEACSGQRCRLRRVRARCWAWESG